MALRDHYPMKRPGGFKLNPKKKGMWKGKSLEEIEAAKRSANRRLSERHVSTHKERAEAKAQAALSAHVNKVAGEALCSLDFSDEHTTCARIRELEALALTALEANGQRAIDKFAALELRTVLTLHGRALATWVIGNVGQTDIDEDERKSVLEVVARLYEFVERIPGTKKPKRADA